MPSCKPGDFECNQKCYISTEIGLTIYKLTIEFLLQPTPLCETTFSYDIKELQKPSHRSRCYSPNEVVTTKNMVCYMIFKISSLILNSDQAMANSNCVLKLSTLLVKLPEVAKRGS